MSKTITVSSNEEVHAVLKVAFATTNMEDIDAHFGSAKQFAVYNVSSTASSLHQIIKMEQKDTDTAIDALRSVDIVYFVNIGPTAAAKVINAKIFPIKYKEITSIDKELKKLSHMISTNPPPFIKKILQRSA